MKNRNSLFMMQSQGYTSILGKVEEKWEDKVPYLITGFHQLRVIMVQKNPKKPKNCRKQKALIMLSCLSYKKYNEYATICLTVCLKEGWMQSWPVQRVFSHRERVPYWCQTQANAIAAACVLLSDTGDEKLSQYGYPKAGTSHSLAYLM